MEIVLSVAFGVWYILSALFYKWTTNKEEREV